MPDMPTLPLDWSLVPFEDDDSALTLDIFAIDNRARIVTLSGMLGTLVCPDSRLPLIASGENSIAFPDGEIVKMRGARPTLLPAFARRCITSGHYQFGPDAGKQAKVQYLSISDSKAHGGDQNSPYENIWYKRHIYRTRRLTQNASGSLLDIGCDSPSISSRLFPVTVDYVGLEPSLTKSDEFCVCGMAEFLPFRDASFDNVALITSLDHILDDHQAIDEAFRVLRPGGYIYLASLVWSHNASLIADTVHFHHFRDWEIQGLLRRFALDSAHKYRWKGDEHRYGIYLRARKPTSSL